MSRVKILLTLFLQTGARRTKRTRTDIRKEDLRHDGASWRGEGRVGIGFILTSPRENTRQEKQELYTYAHCFSTTAQFQPCQAEAHEHRMYQTSVPVQLKMSVSSHPKLCMSALWLFVLKKRN